jgi:hypothetical protein
MIAATENPAFATIRLAAATDINNITALAGQVWLHTHASKGIHVSISTSDMA